MLEHSTPSEQHQSSNLTTQCESQYEERASKAAEGERAAEADFTATAAPDGHESDSDSSMVNRNGDEEEEDDEPSAEIPYPGFERIVFKCLPQTHRLRLICLHLITSPWFEKLVIIVILLNCLTLGMYQPCKDAEKCQDTRCEILSVSDNVIYAFFVLEMIIKVIAMGFLGKKGYLAETWNKLDMFIIVAGTVDMIYSAAAEYGMGNGEINLSAIRTIRVLRPLRAINRIPNLRILVMLLLDTLPMLGNVLLICFFVFFIFGILGVQLWAGMLKQRCFMSENMTQRISDVYLMHNRTNDVNPYYTGSWSSLEFICSGPENNGMLSCDAIEPTLENGIPCTEPFSSELLAPDYIPKENGSCININQYYTECKPEGPNPFQEAISFDNIASAWIAIFQVISMEGWVDIMYYIQDVHSFWVWVYFLALIVIGSFFMVNLFLVVIATQFSETKRRETEKIAEERKRYKSSTTLTSTKTENDGCYNQMLKYVIYLCRKTGRKIKRSYRNWLNKRNPNLPEADENASTDIKLNVFSDHVHCRPCYHMTALMENTTTAPIASPEPSDIDTISYFGLTKQMNASPRFFRRSSKTSPISLDPVILVSSEQDETSFNSSAIPTNSNSVKNGGINVIVDANEGPENAALLHVVPQRVSLSSHSVTSGSRPPSVYPSPLSSPQLSYRQVKPALHSPQSLCEHKSLTDSHPPLFRSSSQGNHLMVPHGSLGFPSPTLSNRLRVPGDMGSVHSIQSRSSYTSAPRSHSYALSGGMISNGVNHFKPSLPEKQRSSFSQFSYLQNICGLCCPECQHLCVENQKKKAEDKKKAVSRFGIARENPENEKLSKIRSRLQVIVNSRAFRNFIMIAILVNTVMMGVEHHNQPDILTEIVEKSNYLFIGIFTIEMLFKLVAEGGLQYIKDIFNVFDGIIVILSFVEIGMGENSGLSVLRTFRLLRILKLIRFLPALQQQFIVMVRTLDNVASFFGLLILFMFIFSVLGMNLFGCLFCEEQEDGTTYCSRRNFDSLLWSLITVFQILTQEDWNIIMYDGMAKTSPWAALYFVALMTIGNYVLFNLLVAILVEGFSSVSKKKLNNFLRKRVEKMSKDRGQTAHLPAKTVNAKIDEIGDEPTEKPVVTETGGILPSIITDHADVHSKELKLKMPPIITHTAATPRGSPKSEVILSSHFQSMHEQDNLSIENGKNMSPGNRHSNSSSPRFIRKNSSSSRKPKSEDKVSLMELSSSDDEVDTTDLCRLTISSADSRSRNGSIKNFDLLQVPGRQPMTSSLPEVPIITESQVCSSSNDQLEGPKHKSWTELSLQIPEPISLPEVNKNCNGNAMLHPPFVQMNGNSQKHGESSPLLAIQRPKDKIPTFSTSSIDIRENEELACGSKKHQSKISNGSLYNCVNVNDKEKQFPYSDQQKSETKADETCQSKDRSFFQKLGHACRPRGCLQTRENYSLYVFSPSNRYRRFCKWLSSRKWFDYCILVLIGLNCIGLAVERPSIPQDSVEREVLTIANYVFTLLFLLEMLIKISARGLIIGADTYLKDGWNINDGFLVLVSVIDASITFSNAESPKIFGVLRVLRLLRALRPLRVISRAPGLKLVVETLLSSLRPIGNIVLICLTFFLIFGILGVQLFRGIFHHCDGEDVKGVVTKADCLDRGYEWTNHRYNFDNLGNALISLFVLASKDGWVMIMYQGLDAVGIDLQPIENYKEWRLLYFISFLLLVGFFVLNMFVGVVVENFHRCREAHEKEEKEKREKRRQKKLTKKLTTLNVTAIMLQSAAEIAKFEEEIKGANTAKKKKSKADELNQEPYHAKYGKARKWVYHIVINKFFDIAVSIIIFCNVISMAVEHHNMSKEMIFALDIMNYVFTFIFILEAAFKIIAYGFVRYIKERWNQLDMLIIILSIVGIVLEKVQNDVIPINPTIMRVMRILRIARVLKLLKVAKGIRALLDTVLVALPQVANLGLLFFLLFFIFAALGVELFGRIECSNKNPCEGMGVHANFENSGAAFLTLFRIATGDNWNGIMKDALRTNCDNSIDCIRNCCVNKVVTPIYFVVFVLTAQFVLVNVVVAVLMKHLEVLLREQQLTGKSNNICNLLHKLNVPGCTFFCGRHSIRQNDGFSAIESRRNS